ncbi:MAG: hypothetical protein EZS28_028850 [Streblomastix strix]|uniref:Uncharacterized protein n=1 Tax=Streblomastix strix TaxID=222440 RepID=A0A5J4UZI1_9EUKA|nr:MAG: hypothetical protein EZS28_028850 [Streblomastix strix]
MQNSGFIDQIQCDEQTLAVRQSSRDCLSKIKIGNGVFFYSELVNIRYVGVLIITISAAGRSGEEQDSDIYDGLDYIYKFLKDLHYGENHSNFPRYPQLYKRSLEQIEEEGGNEEVEALYVNKGSIIKQETIKTKGSISNYFINQNNREPD